MLLLTKSWGRGQFVALTRPGEHLRAQSLWFCYSCKTMWFLNRGKRIFVEAQWVLSKVTVLMLPCSKLYFSISTTSSVFNSLTLLHVILFPILLYINCLYLSLLKGKNTKAVILKKILLKDRCPSITYVYLQMFDGKLSPYSDHNCAFMQMIRLLSALWELITYMTAILKLITVIVWIIHVNIFSPTLKQLTMTIKVLLCFVRVLCGSWFGLKPLGPKWGVQAINKTTIFCHNSRGIQPCKQFWIYGFIYKGSMILISKISLPSAMH